MTGLNSSHRRRCFITSVGTSLKDNAGAEIEDEQIDSSSPEEDISTILNNIGCNDTRFSPDSINNVLTDVIEDEIFCAEIKALNSFGIHKEDKIILIPSLTLPSYWCAKAIEYYYQKLHDPPIQDVEIKPCIGLGDAKDPNFANRGLPDFLNIVVEMVKSHADAYDIVLNPTGGYKSLFPFMTQVGILYEKPVIYIHQESDVLVVIPRLPLHVNIPAWTQMETLIQLLPTGKNYQDNKLFKEYRYRLGPLLYEKGQPDGSTSLCRSALVSAFDDYVRNERGKPELIVRTENSPLVHTFLTDEQREIFEKLTRIGHLIWKGDRVPEMADHALRHHSDLFHLAERVLLPIFYYNEKFLEPHELFVLLCALYLHDCGHVIGSLHLEDGEIMPFFPTEIRDHHHVLGFLRLKYPERCSYLGYLIYNALCGTDAQPEMNCIAFKPEETPSAWQQAWEEYLCGVAHLGLYHRKRMCLTKGKTYRFFEEYNLPDSDKRFPVLKNLFDGAGIKAFDQEIPYERFILLVSLLRVIDSLDEQASRTGGMNDINFHLAQLRSEVNEDGRRATYLQSVIPIAKRDELDGDLSRVIDTFRQSEEKGCGKLTDNPMSTLDLRKKWITGILDEEERHRIFEYSSTRLRKAFKEFQINPYAEKAYIRGIQVGHEYKDGKVRIIVDLELEKEDVIRQLQPICPVILDSKPIDMTSADGQAEYRKAMLDAIKAEFFIREDDEGCGKKENEDGQLVVKEALERVGVEFIYGK